MTPFLRRWKQLCELWQTSCPEYVSVVDLALYQSETHIPLLEEELQAMRLDWVSRSLDELRQSGSMCETLTSALESWDSWLECQTALEDLQLLTAT
jgi:hypothetical protein